MGRIQKKKDPEKKKLQRIERTNGDASDKAGDVPSRSKSSPVMRKSQAAIKAKSAGTENGVVQKSIQFLREVKIELKKVTWPTRKQTLGSTAVVIVLVMVISLFLGVVDAGLSSLIRVVLP